MWKAGVPHRRRGRLAQLVTMPTPPDRPRDPLIAHTPSSTGRETQ
jgi:hypothetical protein